MSFSQIVTEYTLFPTHSWHGREINERKQTIVSAFWELIFDDGNTAQIPRPAGFHRHIADQVRQNSHGGAHLYLK